MTLHQLRARRAELRAEGARIATAAEAAGGFTDETRAAFDTVTANLESVTADETRMERAQTLDLATARPLDGAPGAHEYRVFEGGVSRLANPVASYRTRDGDRVPVLGREQRIASFATPTDAAAADVGVGGFLGALAFGPRNDAERRVLGSASVGAGGAFLPTPLSAEVIDMARTRTVALLAGARTVPMTAKTLRLARVLSYPQPAWRAENAAIAESDPTFGDMTLDAKTLAVRFNVSRELLEDAPGLDSQILDIMGAAFGIGLDSGIFYGTGAANQPRGLANTPGLQIVSMGTNGATPASYAPVLDAVAALEGANEGAVSAIVYAPRTARTMNGLVDSTGQPLVPPGRLAGIPTLATTGIPITETQGTPNNASSVFLGDFSQVLVGIRTSLQITVLQERFAEVGQVGFVGWLRADVGIARPQALARIQGVRP